MSTDRHGHAGSRLGVEAMAEMSSAARAFDAVADSFDQRFGDWRSVASQRRVVRETLERTFPPGSRLIEIGGGTGEDALWLVERGRDVLMTDASPAMIRAARAKFAERRGARAEVGSAEALGPRHEPLFDGAFSNFAAINCVTDLAHFARNLARLLRPGAPALLVVFGTLCPNEMVVEAIRRRPRNMLRRLSRGDVPARLGGYDFTVRYHRRSDLARAMTPWFELEGRQGIGVFVPPSSAEPWISAHPRLLGALEALDRRCATALAPFGDHVLYRFRRTPVKADSK